MNYLCNALCQILLKIKSIWRCEIKKQKIQLTLVFFVFKGKVDSPESPETPEITEMTDNFTKVTKYLTKLKDTLINYV